jgi:hypothetical protein
MLRKTVVLFFYLLCQVSGWLCSAVPPKERAALIAFYHATHGDTWDDNSGWKQEPLEADGFGPVGSEGNWYGISVGGDHVTEIFIPHYNLLMKGFLPAELGDLVYLERLKLSGDYGIWFCILGGEIPPELGNLVNLQYLDLSFNDFHGTIPKSMGNMKQLQELYLDFNRLSGTIPKELGKLENLNVLALDNNELSGGLPPELGNLTRLRIFRAYFNSFSGSLPPEWGGLRRLEELHLQLNGSLGGNIPPQFGNMENLKVLNLSYNSHAGPLPPELGNLNSLKQLHLSFNQFSGSIPAEMGTLGELNQLFLDHNHFSGRLPQELGQLCNLRDIDLRANRLAGEIPSSFIHIPLRYFNFDFNGLYSHNESLRRFLNQLHPNWESTQTVAPADLAASAVGTSSIKLSWTPIAYSSGGGYRVYYRPTPGGPYTYAGMTSGTWVSSFTLWGLEAGTTYFCTIISQSDPCIDNKNTVFSERSREVKATTQPFPPGHLPPFGTMALPLTDGEPRNGCIAVNGWALDDRGVESVNLYHLVEGRRVYLGNADFVQGARPDVEQAYPGYPNNSRAGWGYVLLTNLLPNGGKGFYDLQTVAVDDQGYETILGTRTIFCDNGQAQKPFGTIDTPAPGSTASGSEYINFGWALPGGANFIPTDGSTITVWLDGIPLGYPVYNRYRRDIELLFPFHNNNRGAGGNFLLDTSLFEKGQHTIAWSVTDESGNTAGLGSRYFFLENPGNGQGAAAGSNVRQQGQAPGDSFAVPGDLLSLTAEANEPVGVIKGYGQDRDPQKIYPDEHRVLHLELQQLERVALYLTAGREMSDSFSPGGQLPGRQWMGFLVRDGELSPLPIGSFLDMQGGIFYWQPGPAFLGNYRLVFFETDCNGGMKRKDLSITLSPYRSYGDDNRRGYMTINKGE